MPYLGLQVLKLSSGIDGRLPVPALVQFCLPLLIGLRQRPRRLEEDLCAHRAHQHIRVAQRHFFLQNNSSCIQFLSTQACPRPELHAIPLSNLIRTASAYQGGGLSRSVGVYGSP